MIKETFKNSELKKQSQDHRNTKLRGSFHYWRYVEYVVHYIYKFDP